MFLILLVTRLPLCVQAGPAVCLPPGLHAAQPGAAVPAQPHGVGAHASLPGLQLRLQPLQPQRAGAVPLRSLAVAVRRLPQLQLLARRPAACSLCGVPDASGRHPPASSGRAGCRPCPPAGLPPLPPAPARPHAVSSGELRTDGRKPEGCARGLTVRNTRRGRCDVIKKGLSMTLDSHPSRLLALKCVSKTFFCNRHQHTI